MPSKYEEKYVNLLNHFRQTLISENEYKKLYEEAVHASRQWRQIALSPSSQQYRLKMACLIPGELTEENIKSLIQSKANKLIDLVP